MPDQVQHGEEGKGPDPIELECSKEDAATAAAREELKQTVISDETHVRASVADRAVEPDSPPAGDELDPDSLSTDKDLISSPKKKRRHDQVDKEQGVEDSDEHSESSSDSRGRSLRSEPEKKRHRDEIAAEGKLVKSPKSATDPAAAGSLPERTSSAGAFASSGFAKLSSSTSPFGALGAANKPLGFGSSSKPVTAGRSLTPTTISPPLPPTLNFGSPSESSPFASLAATRPNGFGSFGGFKSLGSGPQPLATFGKPGKTLKSDKPAKPFGAPDSDAEDEEGGDDSEDGSATPEENERTEEKEDDRRKVRLQRVVVDDGEAGEATILQVRAKMFHLDKDTGWKEKGAGMLKINVPESCVQLDPAGAAIPGSFDASGLDECPTKGRPRLILRQDQTHRVILNTAILPAMDFQKKTTLKAANILFTALEGDNAKPVSVTMKMTAANSESFMRELGDIQRELRDA